jgi:hypothetical protein
MKTCIFSQSSILVSVPSIQIRSPLRNGVPSISGWTRGFRVLGWSPHPSHSGDNCSVVITPQPVRHARSLAQRHRSCAVDPRYAQRRCSARQCIQGAYMGHPPENPHRTTPHHRLAEDISHVHSTPRPRNGEGAYIASSPKACALQRAQRDSTAAGRSPDERHCR